MSSVSQGLRRLFGIIASLNLLTVSATFASNPSPRLSIDPRDPALATLTIDPPPLNWATGAAGVYPKIDGFGRYGRVTAPDLLLRRQRIAIPPGGSLALVDVQVDWEEGVLPGALAAFPATGDDPPAIDSELFAHGDWWPATVAEVAQPAASFRGLNFGTLALVPVQVDIRRGRFRVARQIRLQLDRDAERRARFAPLAGERRQQRGPLDLALDGMAEQLALGATGVARGPGLALGSEPSVGTLAATTFPAWQFDVSKTGLYRVSYSYAQGLADQGLFQFLTTRDPRQFRLTVQGLEIPIQVVGEADGVFGPGDYIQFFGEALGAVDPFAPNGYQQGDYTDTNVYRLDTAAGARRVTTRSAAPTAFAVPPSFRTTARLEPQKRFISIVPLEGVDHWYNTFITSSGPSVDLNPPQDVPTPFHVGGSVTVRQRLLGQDTASDLHRSSLVVDGSVRDTQDWNGVIEFTHNASFTPPGAQQKLAANTQVVVRIPSLRPTATSDGIEINWVEIDYDRSYDASADSLAFTTPNQNHTLQVNGYSVLPDVWEVTTTSTSSAGLAVAIPTLLTGVQFTAGQARFDSPRDNALGATRRYVATTGAGVFTPAAVREDKPPSTLDTQFGASLKDATQGADWIVIGQRTLLNMTAGSNLRSLITRRQGQGLETRVVDIRDIYDEFTEGIEDPEAIRRFLTHILTPGNWRKLPSYVLLVGDATRDYKNDYGHSTSRQYVPTSMWDKAPDNQFGIYPSDSWFAGVGDDMPDAAVGRIPAHTLSETEAVFSKIVNYETGAHPASWAGRALLVAEADPLNGEPFKSKQDQIFSNYFAAGPQTATKVYEAGETAQDAANQNAAIDSNVNLGAAIVAYIGHGSFRNWGKDQSMFTTYADPRLVDPQTATDDLVDLQSGRPLGFHIHAACITGHVPADTTVANADNDTWYSFLEDWLLTPNKGAIGGFAPSHLTFTFQFDTILGPFYNALFDRTKERIVGNIDLRLRADLDSLNDIVGLRSFMLEGDPALTLALPAPARPAITSISEAGSGKLAVSWSSVAGVPKYRLYRAADPTGPYTRVTETAGTSFTDSGLTNCSEYYYYAVSVDGDGFESRWSNFNDTCFGSGSDCKRGTPHNPTPPHPPTNVTVSDPQRGGQLEVRWNIADREADVVQYRVLWGSSSGNYPNATTVPATSPTATIGGLTNGQTYFIVVRAEHCTLASGNSAERTGVPHRVEGTNPPQSIADLRVIKQGAANLQLNWTVPTKTVWGVDTTVTSVEVHGSQSGPVFPIDGTTLLATLSGTTNNWTHAGAQSGTARWYYSVVAIDGGGLKSAGGDELPGGIETLRVQKLNATQLQLSWDPLRTAINGKRLRIAAYNVYGRASVLPRKDCAAANRLVTDTTATSATLPLPAGNLFTYQVLGKDSYGGESVY